MADVISAPLKRTAQEDLLDQPKLKKRLFGRSLGDSIDLNALSTEADARDSHETDTAPTSALDHEPLPTDSIGELDHRPNHLKDNNPLDTTYLGLRQQPVDYGSLGEEHSSRLGIKTCSGKSYNLCERQKGIRQSYQQIVAERSVTATGKATKSYYGIEIHDLIKEATTATSPLPTVPQTASPVHEPENLLTSSRKKHAMWTEKYRARKFIDLVGDERTHRSVLKWLKNWDSIVFPGATKPKVQTTGQKEAEREHRKILLLSGAPGLGKTTLAHVCARQAGYEALEINASDERSRDVVKGRIRDIVGTENVRGARSSGKANSVHKAAKPVCVIVDEVDGVAGGNAGSGDGGFMKALIDLVLQDQRNSQDLGRASATMGKGRKTDRFRLLRPIVLICNDLYHPSLRPLRSSNLAETINIRKPPLDKVISRVKDVFRKEGVQAETDAVRRLCEAIWGVSSRKDDQGSRAGGEGDMRSILVIAEWAASKLRTTTTSESPLRLSRQWLERNILHELASGGGPRGAGRGSSKEIADRVFLENAGFAKPVVAAVGAEKKSVYTADSVNDATRANALALLRTSVETSGEPDRVLSEVFTSYPSRPFQDDSFLSKPNMAAEWLHFHDTLSSRVHSSQEWELQPYLSASILGFHYLFGSSVSSRTAATTSNADQATEDTKVVPFQGSRADFEAYEVHKQNLSQLQSFHSSLSMALARTFRSPEVLATELIPQLSRMLSPSVNPTVVGGSGEQRGTATVRRESERIMVERGAQAMSAAGISFERSRVEDARGSYSGFVYRMEPPIDTLSTFDTAETPQSGGAHMSRYAVRQVLEQEHKKLLAQQAAAARQTRFAPRTADSLSASAATKANIQPLYPTLDKENIPPIDRSDGGVQPKVQSVKRDFFGRAIPISPESRHRSSGQTKKVNGNKARIWVSYHEGFSNAVKKPIGLKALLDSLS